MRFEPHEYQTRAIRNILETPSVGLFLEMGLGKTVVSLTAAAKLLEDFDVDHVLVVAPLKVAEDTWSRESAKWDHLHWLRISKILGSRQRREEAVSREADVYVINRENVAWLVKNYAAEWKWDMLILDELSSFKSNQSERFKALRRIRPKVHRVVGLTGTPDPNGLMDLWSEIYLLDQGERLESTIGAYRRKYFTPGRSNGYIVYDYIPRPGAQETITRKISDIVVSMKAEDYLKLPRLIRNDIRVDLPQSVRAKYRELERAHFLALDGGDEITAPNAAAVMGKLLQLSGGAIYTDDGGYVVIHSEKIKALTEIIETQSEPVLVFYGYRHEKERITEALRRQGIEPRGLDTEQDIEDWNAGRIRVLLVQPASVGYGLNLQDGGRIIIWYSLPWSLELYQQANARLYRQGQTRPVIITHLITAGSVDEQVVASLAAKDTSQAALMAALKERRKADGGD